MMYCVRRWFVVRGGLLEFLVILVVICISVDNKACFQFSITLEMYSVSSTNGYFSSTKPFRIFSPILFVLFAFFCMYYLNLFPLKV